VTVIDLLSLIAGIPFLILGVVVPFYVGYIRGVIEIDTVEERIRGWIYSIIGTNYFLGSFVISLISSRYPGVPLALAKREV
jgi:hypothetical protein